MTIFHNDHERMKFIHFMKRVIGKYNWICHAYCLMGNHYHLLIETPDANLILGMKQLNQLYSQFFNWKYQRVGSVLQGRYKSWLVEKETRFLENARYIVNNPVNAGLVDHPSRWPWSSFRATSGMEKTPPFLEIDTLLGHFSSFKKRAQSRYEDFVLAGIGVDSPLTESQNQLFLGSDAFVSKAMQFLDRGDSLGNVPRIQQCAGRPSLSDLFEKVPGRSKEYRNDIIRKAYDHFAYTQREIAEHLDLHPGYISKIVLSLRKG